jgi:hypothetical protein
MIDGKGNNGVTPYLPVNELMRKPASSLQ